MLDLHSRYNSLQEFYNHNKHEDEGGGSGWFGELPMLKSVSHILSIDFFE